MAGSSQLYVIRHAVAEERSQAWPDDTKRPLTGDGAARMRQAAEIVAAAFESRPPIVAVESLQPGGSYQSVVSDLEKQSRRARIALVGHEPGIGELASRLIGSRQPLQFKKGAICRVDVDGLPPTDPGTLRWFMTTKILRRIK
jgi:phosphohistidine phosphatase